MYDLFVSLFGSYTPIVTEACVDSVNGITTYATSIDWAYIGNVLFVLIVLYSVCRCIGMLLGGSNSCK